MVALVSRSEGGLVPQAKNHDWEEPELLLCHSTSSEPGLTDGSERDLEPIMARGGLSTSSSISSSETDSVNIKLTQDSPTGSSGFGAGNTGSGGFGQNRPAFGAATTTSGGGLFGSGTATAGTSGGFGGFGNTNNSNNNASGGALFGSAAAKPAFGAVNTGGGLFGGGNTTGGFGSGNTQTTGAFGQPNSSALGQNVGECQGTGNTPFSAFTEKESATGSMTNHFQSISFMAPYRNFSFEVSRICLR